MTLGLNSLRCKEKGGGGLQNGPLHHISPFDAPCSEIANRCMHLRSEDDSNGYPSVHACALPRIRFFQTCTGITFTRPNQR
jgi:hypothetical protein